MFGHTREPVGNGGNPVGYAADIEVTVLLVQSSLGPVWIWLSLDSPRISSSETKNHKKKGEKTKINVKRITEIRGKNYNIR